MIISTWRQIVDALEKKKKVTNRAATEPLSAFLSHHVVAKRVQFTKCTGVIKRGGVTKRTGGDKTCHGYKTYRG